MLDPVLDSTARLDDAALSDAESTENFPVALRFLPKSLRQELRAVYGVARTIDHLGDEAPGDRLALLDEYADDVARIWHGGAPRLDVNQRLASVVHTHQLDEEPFQNLIAANRKDQTTPSYRTWDDLRDYCKLSADPVGRIVLQLTDSATPQRIAWSDDVCTALQLLEHCQDVGEDRRAGRIYLPGVDLSRFGVTPEQLDARRTSTGLRGLISFETARATDLLQAGRPLVVSLHGSAKLAVAGFVAGGLATADGLRRDGFDVLAVSSKPRTRDVAKHLAWLLAIRS